MSSNQEYLGLHNLVAPTGARQDRKRLGRGEASGRGKTAGRGHKGQKARKSGNVRIGFEGGQNPLARRIPKRGFNNHNFRTVYHTVNVERLSKHFEAGATVDIPALVAVGLAPKMKCKVKLLSDGKIDKALTVKLHAVSKSAEEKIKQSGGSVELIA